MPVRLGIRGRLLLWSLATIVVTALVLDAYVSSTLRQGIEERMAADLRARASLVAHEVEAAAQGIDHQDLAVQLGRRAFARVTLIARDGAVVGDSELAPTQLPDVENHASRPEVREALGAGAGVAERSSVTVRHGLLYVALRTADAGPVAVVRLAESLSPVEASVSRSRELLLAGTALAIAVAALLSSLGAHLAAQPLRALRRAADRMLDDLSARTRVRGADEVGALGEALDRLAGTLSESLERLRRERDRLEAILETMEEGVLVTDQSRRIVLANSSLRRLLGDTGAAGEDRLEPVATPELAAILASVCETQAPASVEVDGVGAAARRVHVRAAPLAIGAEPGVVAVLSDVTELRRLESMRRDFVANVSHELRTPIAAIRAATETLEGGALDDADAAREFLGMIARHGERLHRLVEDLLDLSRIEAQKVDLAREPVALGELLDRVAELYQPTAAQSGVTLSRAASPVEPVALADRRALEQVVANLVENAIKYAPGATVMLSAHTSAGVATLAVSDTGPGIAPEHLPRLFERFYRVDAGRSRAVGGTGLGLSIAKHLVEAMRGTICAASVPGRGATFEVRLPAADDASTDRAPASVSRLDARSRTGIRRRAPSG